MKKIAGAFFAILLCGFLPAVSSGQLITIGITGNVSSVYDPHNIFGGQIHSNDTITGTYTYDTSTPDSNPSNPSLGRYWHYSQPCGVSVNINSFNFRTDPDNVNFLLGISNDNGGDIYWFHSYSNSPLPDGTLVDSIAWQITDSTGTALSNDSLPTTAPNLTSWDMDYGLHISGPPRTAFEFEIITNITSVVLVPEPATICLFALGGLMLRKIKFGDFTKS